METQVDNTVADVAGRLKVDVNRLLGFIKDAGLPHGSSTDEFSSGDMQTLQAHLLKRQKSAGAKTAEATPTVDNDSSAASRTAGLGLRPGQQATGLGATLSRRGGTLSVQRTPGAKVKVATVRRRRLVKPASGKTSEQETATEALKQATAKQAEQPGELKAKSPAKAPTAKKIAPAAQAPKQAKSQLQVETEKNRREEKKRREAETEVRKRQQKRTAEIKQAKDDEQLRKAQAKLVESQAEAERQQREIERMRQEAREAAALAESEFISSAKSGPKRGKDDKGSRSGRRTLQGTSLGRRKKPSGLSLDRLGVRRRKKAQALDIEKQGGEFSRPVKKIVRDVDISDAILVGDLARRMSVKAGEVIKTLMNMGEMVTINQTIDQDTAVLVVEEMGHRVKLVSADPAEEELVLSQKLEGEEKKRCPVVTVMGHVDHGKTSLLDYIRKTHVVNDEKGGITQHIGAYHVETEHGAITFLDTPGHAAFSAMRARGAVATDIAVIACAADDGVMPQTVEAVQHAKAAEVPIIVAVNKMDLPSADPDRVRTEMNAIGVIPDDWGGNAQFVNVSATTGDGIDDLLSAITLLSEVEEFSAVFEGKAQGIVVESKLDRGRGPLATVLIQNGTLKKGDVVLAGECYGRVRSLINDQGKVITEAGPSIPVEILGLNGAPVAGDSFNVTIDEKQARQLADARLAKNQKKLTSQRQSQRLENMFAGLGKGEKRILKIILKADVRGSLEAISQACEDIGNDEVAVQILGSGVGGITESDANMAQTYDAMIFGFNVRLDQSAKAVVEQHSLRVTYYSVIYELLDDIKKILEDMLMPEIREEIVGTAEVRDVFHSPRFGQVAGCLVVEGTVFRNKKLRVLRDSTVIYEGELESLRRFKNDVIEVRHGMECGIGVRNYNDVRTGDRIEVFDSREVARVLA